MGMQTHALNTRLLRYRSDSGAEDALALARDLMLAERYGDARGVVVSALGEEGDDAGLFVLEGRAWLLEGEALRAQAAFLRAVKADPESAEALRWLGEALVVRGELARAEKALERSLAIDPTDERAQALYERVLEPKTEAETLAETAPGTLAAPIAAEAVEAKVEAEAETEAATETGSETESETESESETETESEPEAEWESESEPDPESYVAEAEVMPDEPAVATPAPVVVCEEPEPPAEEPSRASVEIEAAFAWMLSEERKREDGDLPTPLHDVEVERWAPSLPPDARDDYDAENEDLIPSPPPVPPDASEDASAALEEAVDATLFADAPAARRPSVTRTTPGLGASPVAPSSMPAAEPQLALPMLHRFETASAPELTPVPVAAPQVPLLPDAQPRTTRGVHRTTARRLRWEVLVARTLLAAVACSVAVVLWVGTSAPFTTSPTPRAARGIPAPASVAPPVVEAEPVEVASPVEAVSAEPVVQAPEPPAAAAPPPPEPPPAPVTPRIEAEAVEAMLRRALAHLRAARPVDAVAALEPLSETREVVLTPSQRARFRLLMGRAYIERRAAGDRDAAQAILRKATAADGVAPEAYFWLGEALAGREWPLATEAFRRYLELEPTGAYAARAKRALGPLFGAPGAGPTSPTPAL